MLYKASYNCLSWRILASLDFRPSRFIPFLYTRFLHSSLSRGTASTQCYQKIALVDRGDLDRSYPLLINYLKNPQYALSLKALQLFSLRDWNSDRSPKDQLCEFRDGSHERLFIDAVDKLRLDEEHTNRVQEVLLWMGRFLLARASGHQMPYGYPSYYGIYAQAVAALIISMAPNIEKFTISDHCPLLATLLLRNNHGLVSPPLLQNLRHVRFTTYSRDHYWDAREYNNSGLGEVISMFHRLPNLESFSFAGASFEQADERLLPGSSTVKRIRIDHCDVACKDIASCVRLSKGLEELRVSTGGRTCNKGGTTILYPKVVGRALYQAKETIRVIDIDLDEGHGFRYDNLGINQSTTLTAQEFEDVIDKRTHFGELVEDRPIEEWMQDPYWKLDLELGYLDQERTDTRLFGTTVGSFRDFQALKSLSIGVNFLLGTVGPTPFRLIDALPPSLEYLRLRGYRKGENNEHDMQINELLENIPERLPNLSKLLGVDEEIPSSRECGNAEKMDKDGEYLFDRSPTDMSNIGREVTDYFREPLEDTEWIEAPVNCKFQKL